MRNNKPFKQKTLTMSVVLGEFDRDETGSAPHGKENDQPEGGQVIDETIGSLRLWINGVVSLMKITPKQ